MVISATFWCQRGGKGYDKLVKEKNSIANKFLDGRTDRRTDGRTDGRMDGRTDD